MTLLILRHNSIQGQVYAIKNNKMLDKFNLKKIQKMWERNVTNVHNRSPFNCVQLI